MQKVGYMLAGMVLGAILTQVFFASGAAAQDPAKVAPDMYRVILENNWLRVIDYHIKPGEKEPMHSHPQGVLVYPLTDAHMRVTAADGKTTDAKVHAGQVAWRDPATHFGTNVGDSEVHELLVEPKPCQQGTHGGS